MTNKIKNIISNLIGLGVIALGTVRFLENDNLVNFVSLLTVGLAAFLFKMSETKSWISRILSSKIPKVSQEAAPNKDVIIGDAPDPNKEEK